MYVLSFVLIYTCRVHTDRFSLLPYLCNILNFIFFLLLISGIDTSYDWETFAIQDRYAILLEDKTFDIDSDRKSKKGGHPKDVFLVTERAVNEFHHAYISEHCEKLLYNLFQLKQGN